MESLKSVLQQDNSKKTKSELIDLLSGLRDALTPAVYEEISGAEIEELKTLKKDEILDILENFKTGYDPKWEASIANTSKEVLKSIFGQIAADEALFSTSDVADGGFAAELGSIDFATIIGGPLDACVKAQSNASISTVSFIKEVGFEDDNGESKLRMANFKYKRNVANPDYDPEDNTSSPTIVQDNEINVPFIALLNVPSFRIETCEVDFNVKLNSTYTKNVSNEFGINAGASGGFGPVKFKVDVSYKRSSSTGIKIEKEYSLGVKVKATNDEMPAGLERVLGLLGSTA